jgi:hypothetical protein
MTAIEISFNFREIHITNILILLFCILFLYSKRSDDV